MDEITDNTIGLILIQEKAASLAELIMFKMMGRNVTIRDEVDETLIRCVNLMVNKHHYYFNSLINRIDFNMNNGHQYFKTIADEIFEGQRRIINWGRVIALYSFAGQFAIYCQQNNLENFAVTLSSYVGDYASETIAPFVVREGGWEKICQEYPADSDAETKMWNVLVWIAMGLTFATLVTFLTAP